MIKHGKIYEGASIEVLAICQVQLGNCDIGESYYATMQ